MIWKKKQLIEHLQPTNINPNLKEEHKEDSYDRQPPPLEEERPDVMVRNVLFVSRPVKKINGYKVRCEHLIESKKGLQNENGNTVFVMWIQNYSLSLAI